MTAAVDGWIAALVAILTGTPANDNPDSWLGLATSGLAGAAAALAVAIALSVYFRSRYRSPRDIARHSLAAVVVLGLLAFAAYDMRHAAMDYLGINVSTPAVEFEIRVPNAITTAAARDGQVELRTDRNQTLAQLRGGLSIIDSERSVLKGSVALNFRTAHRVVVLNLPGQPRRLFKLRLAASPSHSDEFGPWHLPDEVASSGSETARTAPNDAYAIRYRVL